MTPERKIVFSIHLDQHRYCEEGVQSKAYGNHEQLVDVIKEAQPVAQLRSLEYFQIHYYYRKKDRQE